MGIIPGMTWSLTYIWKLLEYENIFER
jgi:hypothetical protein